MVTLLALIVMTTACASPVLHGDAPWWNTTVKPGGEANKIAHAYLPIHTER